MPFTGSIVSYPQRGPYGKSSYRGNTTGYLVRDFLGSFHQGDGLFCDPAEGGGTSGDVARELAIRYRGLDLQMGFNLLVDDLGQRLGEPAQTVFFHPPYHGMVRYNAGPGDLSAFQTLEEFLDALQLCLWNIYDALAPSGIYGILMGNWRHKGEYLPLASLIYSLAPGKLREEIIKVQHNTTSGRTPYAGAFIPIQHEKLLIYQKDRVVFALDVALHLADRLAARHAGTWRNLIQRVLMQAGAPVPLDDVYSHVQATPKALANPNWRAKVRQTLGQNPDLFQRVTRGTYALQ